MRPRPLVVDEGPLSEFITKMRDAHRRRLAAVDLADKLAIEREMKGFMTQYLGRDAWEASVAAERAAGLNVPRATRRRGRFTAPSKYSGDRVDRKLAAAGDRERDDE